LYIYTVDVSRLHIYRKLHLQLEDDREARGRGRQEHHQQPAGLHQGLRHAQGDHGQGIAAGDHQAAAACLLAEDGKHYFNTTKFVDKPVTQEIVDLYAKLVEGDNDCTLWEVCQEIMSLN
jgi:hypothetical protein